MSDLINKIDKRVYTNKPTTNKYGQYNVGRVLSGDNATILGKTNNSVDTEDTDLYTYVMHKEKVKGEYPSGVLWPTSGSKIQVTECNIGHDVFYESGQVDSHRGLHRNVFVSFYIFDSASPSGKKIEEIFNTPGASWLISQVGTSEAYQLTSLANQGRDKGNSIRAAIGEGNSVNTSPFCIGHKWVGEFKDKKALGNVIEKYTELGDVSVNNFPRKTTSTKDTFKNSLSGLSSTQHDFLCTDCEGIDDYIPAEGDTIFDVDNFYDGIRIPEREDAYYVVVRIGGDERDKRPGARGRDDKIDRHYHVAKIPKTKLFPLWSVHDADPIELDFIWTNENTDSTTFRHYRDEYGDGRGYTDWTYYGDNKKWPIYHVSDMKITITAPSWSAKNALLSVDDGGINANWVNRNNAGWWCVNTIQSDDAGVILGSGERQGLNPKYNIDFFGFPSDYYYNVVDGLPTTADNATREYFKGSLINDVNFRPISYISSSANNIDIQNYYSTDSDIGIQLNNLSSAPNAFNLSFRLSEEMKSTNIQEPKSDSDTITDFNHWFFVINWEWKDGDLGGGGCEDSTAITTCIDELADTFPAGTFDLKKNESDDLFKLKKVSLDDSDWVEAPDVSDIELDGYNEIPNIITHQYNEPGLKIIKVIVFSTLENNMSGYENYKQAVHWKLVTVRANIPEDPGIISDFEDVGGNNFVYLPFPSINNLSLISSYTALPYRTSHPVISGLSEESIYVKSLHSIIKTNKFGLAEIAERIKAKAAYNNSPKGRYNEYGDFLGKSDIAQVRFFNQPFDMATLLDINIAPTTSDFIPHSSLYWDCRDWDTDRIYCFEESPVDDIFINGYSEFTKYCLFEINFNALDGKTVRDSSGNGNKAILFGDYSIKKKNINKKTIRDSYIKTPKLGRKNGAI